MQQFRCYAFKKNEHWYAACIDLNLVDRAESLDTVVDKLKENIQLYMQDKDVVAFRRMPLSYQFQYQWILFKTWLLSRHRGTIHAGGNHEAATRFVMRLSILKGGELEHVGENSHR